ncbi:MAG: YggS family pyridoxal phosphate-dependent enzyme [candidate division WOR-3 bacterium]|nr:MAG: YggS family pyridoxal phosphate-dependent enzyme [candidate division WOR-3 bacterium]
MSIADNIAHVKQRIRAAAQRSGRNPDDIALVAVTKTITAEIIEQAISHGISIIGENRVQEAKRKYADITDPVTWHMVGHLQTNKVKDALKIFSLIHSLDSLRLAREINKRATKPIACLIEVNTSEETTKYGIKPAQILKFFSDLQPFTNIAVQGLMTIGPGWAIHDPQASRSSFKLLRTLRDDLQRQFHTTLPVLSMGMTSDFEVAIEEDSTMVRIGTAIFGPRSP